MEELIVNGITLPPHVAEELRLLGMPLAGYAPWQLQEAVQAAVIDGRVIEDRAPENPFDLSDMLEFSAEEAAARAGETTITGMITAGIGGVAALPGLVGGFVAKLLEERTNSGLEFGNPLLALSVTM